MRGFGGPRGGFRSSGPEGGDDRDSARGPSYSLRVSTRRQPRMVDRSYNIERLGEDRYQIALAVAGFSPDEISITAEQNVVTIEGGRPKRPPTVCRPHDTKLKLLSSYAHGGGRLAETIALGEGLAGQCAVEKKSILLKDVPPDFHDGRPAQRLCGRSDARGA